MKKNRFLNYKFCFTTFWKVLALYDHFWVTYAKNLKKTEICSFSQNFDRELINYSGMWIDTDMRFFAKVPQCNLVRCPPRRGASRPSKKISVEKSLGGGVPGTPPQVR